MRLPIVRTRLSAALTWCVLRAEVDRNRWEKRHVDTGERVSEMCYRCRHEAWVSEENRDLLVSENYLCKKHAQAENVEKK